MWRRIDVFTEFRVNKNRKKIENYYLELCSLWELSGARLVFLGVYECKYLKFGIPYNFFMSEAPVSENESQKLKLLEVN